ncbi:hypothetical protein HYR54_10710 [Candidatus Acetothermia bacterium]|nr:hypothetical protein [Candidatus Acetothermia bacterium]MBI3461430.1 hypothetical protein [Candidatus Acetothermia bacterium]MBI3659784.1 hypothetical protein [Candidatus Acetothermia bacterium]
MSSPPKGVIYDQGYRPYEGRFGGRRAALWTMIWADFQRALGIKKSGWYKFGLAFLLALIVIPAIFLAFTAYLLNNLQQVGQLELRLFLSAYYDWTNTWLLLLSAMIASDLLCNDRRYRVLPLYLARPIESYDYLLAKSAAIFGFLFVVSLVPALGILATKVFLSENAIQFLGTHGRDVGATLLSSLIYPVFYGSFAMAASSLTVSRNYAFWGAVGSVILSGLIAASLLATHNDYLSLINFSQIVAGAKNALYGVSANEWVRIFSARIETTLPSLDPWVYAGAYIAFVTACASVIYSVYRREGL